MAQVLRNLDGSLVVIGDELLDQLGRPCIYKGIALMPGEDNTRNTGGPVLGRLFVEYEDGRRGELYPTQLGLRIEL